MKNIGLGHIYTQKPNTRNVGYGIVQGDDFVHTRNVGIGNKNFFESENGNIYLDDVLGFSTSKYQGGNPPVPPQPDFYTQLLTTGDTITLTNWDDASKPRYIGVPTNSIGSGAPNFLIRDIAYSAASKVLVNSTTMDTFETLEYDDKTFFKVYHKDHTAPLGRWIIDDRQGGIDIWLLMDSNTDQPYEE